MDDGRIYEFEGWTEEEMERMGMYSLMKDSGDSPEVIFDED